MRGERRRKWPRPPLRPAPERATLTCRGWRSTGRTRSRTLSATRTPSPGCRSSLATATCPISSCPYVLFACPLFLARACIGCFCSDCFCYTLGPNFFENTVLRGRWVDAVSPGACENSRCNLPSCFDLLQIFFAHCRIAFPDS